MFDSASVGIRRWLVGLFVQAIRRVRHPEDRHAAIVWLLKSRDILAGDLVLADKLKALNAQIEPRTAASAISGEVAAAVMGYRAADVPWTVKMAIPATLFAKSVEAWPAVALQRAGAVAFGTAVGLPALILVHLGTTGITAIIEGVVTNPHSAAGIALVAARILQAETTRGATKWVVDAMVDDPVAPCAAAMPREEDAIHATLRAMDPHDFAKHVMSGFEKAGLEAVVTPKSKDQGLDGYAHHPNGLIVVQCKRHGLENKVGGPAIRQFRSAMADAAAWRGYVVTTSCFTAGAVSEARKEPGLVLVDMDTLVGWHTGGFGIAA